jgi:acetyltransferase-like isoleucine patch superfamily enzyme
VGRQALLYGGSTFHGQLKLNIEDDVFVNQNCHFDTAAPITLRSGTRIGDHVRFITSTHEIGASTRRAGPGKARPIVVGRGVWVGSGACILPGVSVADGCIIAAGAYLTRSTQPDGLYAGVPARRVRDLPVQEGSNANA